MKKFLFLLPILAFSAPLGLGNTGIGIIGALAALPLLAFSLAKRINGSAPLILFIVLTSLINSLFSEKVSLFQFFRTGVPFILSIVSISLISRIQRNFELAFMKPRMPKPRLVITIFVAGLFLQGALLYLGIPLANQTLATEASAGVLRAFLFPLSPALLVFSFCVLNKQYACALMLALVLLLTGSKAVIACLGVSLASLVFIKLKSSKPSKGLSLAVAGCAILAAAIYFNPTALTRLTEFSSGDNFTDATRATQIVETKKTLMSSPSALLFGKGLLVPIKPPAETTNARWLENSQYDVENGYWMLLAKLGLLGAALTLLLIKSIGLDFFSFTGGFIASLISIGSGAIIFNLDGTYLIIWIAFLRAVSNVASLKARDLQSSVRTTPGCA